MDLTIQRGYTLKLQAWHKQQQKMYHVIAFYLGGKEQGITCKNEDTAFHTFPLDEVILRLASPFVDQDGAILYHGDVVKMFDWEDLELIAWVDNGFYVVPLDSEDVSPSLIPHDHKGRAKSVKKVGDIFQNPQYQIGLAEWLLEETTTQ